MREQTRSEDLLRRVDPPPEACHRLRDPAVVGADVDRRDEDAPAGSRHLGDWSEPPVRDEDELFDIVEQLVAIGDGHGVSAAQVALAWLHTRPGVSTVVIGARTDDQLIDNLAAAELKLSADEPTALEKVSRPPLIYPYWHQKSGTPDRLTDADRVLLAPFLDAK